jgi:peptidoglycan/LPS O-acetylase OafA/YrhL
VKLRRITTRGNWIPEIDGLRFVAITATLLVHILGETVSRGGQAFSPDALRLAPTLIDRGDRGVLLFFAISGFILAQPFLNQHLLHGQPVSTRAFFKRRLTRLEPPYILSLLIYMSVLAISQHRLRSLLPSFFTHIVYLRNFLPVQTLNFVTWSLEVEVQFYIVAPLLGYLYAIRPTAVRRGIMILLIFASALIHDSLHGAITWNLPGQLQFFLIGFLLADLRVWRTESAMSRWWDLISFVVWIAIFAIPSRYVAYSLPLFILVAYLAAFNGPVTRQIFRTPWIALTGGMCYSFYLMHMLVISIGFRLTRRWIMPSSLALSYLIQVVFLGAGIYLFCTAYFVLVERPCMDPNWPRKLGAWFSNWASPRKPAVIETSVENR